MKTIKAIIIDDEPLAHRIIERFAVDLAFLEIVGQCYFATDAYAILSTQEIDLIFLDIEMPKLKGLDFLKSLKNAPQVILTTAYEEHALEAFDLHVTDYLLKPFSFDRFMQAINKVQTNLEASKPPRAAQEKKIFVKVDRRQIQVDMDDIYALESYGNYVKIFLEDDMLLTPRTLSSFESELTGGSFERVHKSYLIQRKYIHYVEGHVIYLKNAMEVPVGKSHRSKVRSWFE